MKILIVDDQWEERNALKAILETAGYDAFEACNGAEALSVIGDARLGLIISDIFMPIVDGFMLCREVRRNPRSKRIPFVFHTATFTTADDERLALQVGGSAYLRKPVPPEELLSVVRQLTAPEMATNDVARTDEPSEVDRKYAEALFRKLTEKSSALDEMQRMLEAEQDWVGVLKSIRRIRGLKQAALGELLGVDQSRISRWENGKERPNIGAQKILLDLLKK